jgi:hypothetical protein
MDTSGITESELLEELRAALGAIASDAFTSTELATALSCGDSTVRRKLQPLIASGRVVPTFKVGTNSHGFRKKVCAYRIA